MAVTIYASVPELSNRLGAPDSTDDEKMSQVLYAVSRGIDTLSNTRFYTTTSDETRYYTSPYQDVFYCPDDIISITSLKTDPNADRTYSDTWTTGDYDLLPYNASLNNSPFTHIEVSPNGDYAFPDTPKGVQIIGKFGYSSTTPHEIREATLLLGAKLFRRKDLIFGVAGATDLGQIITEIRRSIQTDSDVAFLLGKYIGRRRM